MRWSQFRLSWPRKPNDPLLLYLQADVLTQKGVDTGTPEFQFSDAFGKEGYHSAANACAARGVMAKLYMQTGQYPEAIEQCRKALEIDPKDQTALYRLIQAFAKDRAEQGPAGIIETSAQLREQASKKKRNAIATSYLKRKLRQSSRQNPEFGIL